jgi:fucose permease
VFCAALIFVSVAADIGFSYWLAEYFSAELAVSIRLSSSVVGIYLAGLILGRLLTPLALKRARLETVLAAGLAIAAVSIFPFILSRSIALKAALCATYGLGIGPVFPLLMAWGSREYPSRSGAVTGVLYGFLSLGGMVLAAGVARLWLLGRIAQARIAGLGKRRRLPGPLLIGSLLDCRVDAPYLWRDGSRHDRRSARHP